MRSPTTSSSLVPLSWWSLNFMLTHRPGERFLHFWHMHLVPSFIGSNEHLICAWVTLSWKKCESPSRTLTILPFLCNRQEGEKLADRSDQPVGHSHSLCMLLLRKTMLGTSTGLLLSCLHGSWQVLMDKNGSELVPTTPIWESATAPHLSSMFSSLGLRAKNCTRLCSPVENMHKDKYMIQVSMWRVAIFGSLS